MFSFVAGIVQRMSYVGIALLTLLENVFPPIPSELIMPLAGFVAEHGELSPWGAITAGTAGSFAGTVLWYLVGRRVGEQRLRAWADRHGRWLTIGGDDIDRAMQWFERRGVAAVFVGRLIPGVRTFISLPAGFARMPFMPFALFTLLGTTIWTAALTLAGMVLGAQYDRVRLVLDPVTWALLGGTLVLYVVRVVRQRRAPPRGSARA